MMLKKVSRACINPMGRHARCRTCCCVYSRQTTFVPLPVEAFQRRPNIRTCGIFASYRNK